MRSVPRSAAARVLAAVLVPLVALPALAGLVVCATSAGVATSWGGRPCPKKGAASVADVVLRGSGDATGVCVVVPDAPDAPLTASPGLRAPGSVVGESPVPMARCPEDAPTTRLDGARGPPPDALGALRTVVLRV